LREIYGKNWAKTDESSRSHISSHDKLFVFAAEDWTTAKKVITLIKT